MERLGAKIKALKKDGRKVLGCFPLYPPVELFHSLGLEPVVLWGLGPFLKTTARSDRHLQNFTCSVGRHLTEFVLSEPGALLDGLFMYNACDTLRNLPEILKYGLEEAGRSLPLAHIHVPQVPRSQTDGSRYLKSEITALIEKMEETYSVGFSPDRFEESVELYRKARDVAGKLEKAAADGRISFREFSALMQGNYFRSALEQINVLESRLNKINADPAGVPGRGSGPRVILSGILPPPAGVCTLIEEAGLRVVGNDVASLARSYAYTPDNSGPAPDYYVDFYQGRHPCPTLLYSADDRAGALEALALKREAQGVLFIAEKFCEYEYFEFPYLEKRLKEKGVHSLILEFALGDDQNLGAYKTRIEAFAELLA